MNCMHKNTPKLTSFSEKKTYWGFHSRLQNQKFINNIKTSMQITLCKHILDQSVQITDSVVH